MGFVYRLYEFQKPCESFRLKPIFWKNCITLIFSGCPRNVYHRVMYIAPSSGHTVLNLNLPFKVVLRRFEVVFWYLEWECCTFWKINGNSFKSTNTINVHVYMYMALKLRNDSFSKCGKYSQERVDFVPLFLYQWNIWFKKKSTESS